MCDPITLTAVSGAMSTYGTSLLASGGAGTFAGTVGSGLVQASTFINTSSTIGRASSAIFGAGSLGTLGTYASLGMSAYSGRLQGDAEMQQARNAEIQARQARANAERERIKYRAEELERRKKYISDLSSSRALMAKYGYTMQSPSANAVLRKNRETYMLDQNAIRMTGIDQVLQQSTQEQVLQGEAGQLRKSARKAPFMAVGRNIQNQFQTLRERAATRKIGGN